MVKGEQSVEQKHGIITLLPKIGKNRLHLKNWRPISLLNTDYKIIVKSLALRLLTVFPNIISDDPSGYLKGRYIGQSNRILEDITFFTKQSKLPGVILSIDFGKAFDSLNWNLLFKSLKHVNLRNTFISYVKTMYTDIESTVLNNDNTSKYFKLQRGLRPGCPLSAYLSIIALETLANKIRNDSNIKGIKIDNNEIKISLLADDITLILLDQNSVKHSLEVLKVFSQYAGLNINIDKTKAKYIGSLMSCDHFPHGLSWIKTPIETLGIVITNNDVTNFKYNFQQRIFTLKATLNIWKQRKLSLKGKITVLNDLVLAPIIHVSSVVNTPNKAIEEINNVIQNFIWNGSTSKIARKTLIHQIDKGCLKLCHFETKVKALKLSWVKRIISENESLWKILPKFVYKCHNLNTYFDANYNLLTKEPIPIFYLEIHNIFMNFFKKEPVNLIDVLTKPLRLNRHILFNKDYIYYKKYQNNGKSLLKDILDNNCEFLDYKILNQKYNLKTFIMSILQIKSSVPSSWKIILKQ